jgi:DNA-binding phage protein
MPVKTAPYDTAEYLTDDETISYYLNDALESNIRILLRRPWGP